MAQPGQDAKHSRARVVALIIAIVVAALAAGAVASALAAPAPETTITAGPSGTYRSGDAQFTLSSGSGGATFECRLDGGSWEPCSANPSFEVANGSHLLEARAMVAGTPDASPATRSWWADATLQNGNFETSLAGWGRQGFTVPGWGSTGATLTVVNGGLAAGDRMGRLTSSGSGFPTLSSSPDPVDATPAGVSFTAKGSVRGHTSGRSVCLKVREYQTASGGDTLVGQGQTCVTTNGSWQSFPTLNYTSQQSGSYLDLLVFQTTSGAAGELIDLDGLSLSVPGSPSVPALPEPAGDPVLLGVADVASCWSAGDEATGRLLDTTPGVIGIAGDTEQNHGEPEEYQGCYEPPWGRHKARTKPAVGDHEYTTPGASGFFEYYGATVGEPGKGWYSYDLGSWHIVVLNSNCTQVGGCGPGSEQYEWLEQDLEQNAGNCVGAYWHHPRWSAGGTHGSKTNGAPFWELLYEYSAEFVYGGNDHNYQRFAPQTPAGEVDNARGLRQFVVGTGGTQHYPLGTPLPNTQVQQSGTFGVLKLTLHANSYDWNFLPQAGRTFTDSGSTACSPLTVDTAAPETTIGSGPTGTVASTSASLAFSSSEPGSTFECKLDDGAWQACTSPRSLTGLAQGPHTFRVRSTDPAGNVDPTEATRTWSVDTVAPNTTITAGPSGAVGSTEASLGFSASESGSSFECKLDDGTWQTCTSPRMLTGLAQGPHTFRVRATDGAGNTDSTEATQSWTVDTQGPETTIGSGPAGTVATTSASLAFSSSESGSSFECKLDDGAWQSCTSPRSLTGLAQGPHTFRVRSTDPAGNVDPTEATRTWSVDTVAPDTSITAGPFGAVPTTSAVLSFTSTESGSAFECKLDSGAWQACTSPRSLSGLAQGAHTFRVRATDPAGNVDQTEATRTWTVDTVAPDTTISGGPSGTVGTASASFTLESSESGSTFECRVDAGSWESCTSPRALIGLAPGPHSFSARATDAAGNTDQSEAIRTWTVDTEAPETTIGGGPLGAVSSTSASIPFASSESGSTFECKLDAGAWQACSSPRSLTGLAQGPHTFRVRATDAAGNADQSEATRTWTVDTVAPNTTIADGPSGTVATGAATLAFSASEPGSSFDCRVDAGDWEPCSSPHSLTGLAHGSHTFRVRATDVAGNTDASEATRSWTVDSQAPDTTIGGGPSGTVGTASASFTLGSTESGSTFECRLDEGDWEGCASPRQLSGLADGERTLRVRATDAVGNTDGSPAARTWTVDTQAPDTTIGGGPSGPTSSTAASFALGSSEPGSGFECRLDAGSWQACGSPHDLDGLAQGSHTLRVRATDAAGNTDPSEAARTWTVDTIAPETAIGSGPTGTVASNRADLEFSADEEGATFECRLDDGAWDACASPTALTALDNGDHTFRVRATDAAGNADGSEATRTWSVDARPPETTITSGPTGGVTVTGARFEFEADEPGATFECRLDAGDWHACNSPSVFSGLKGGQHTFRVRATDSLGNTDPSEALRTWGIQTLPPPTPPQPPKPVPPAPKPADIAPSMASIAAALEADLAVAVRTLKRLRAPRLAKRRELAIAGLRARMAGRFTAKLTARRGGRPVVVARGSSSPTAAGGYRLRLLLTRAGSRTLAASRGAVLTLEIRFTDPSGRTAARAGRLKLRR